MLSVIRAWVPIRWFPSEIPAKTKGKERMTINESAKAKKDEATESRENKIKSISKDDRTIIKARQHEFSIGWPGSEIAPCPGEYLLGALAGCTSGVASIMAKQINFDFRGMEMDVCGLAEKNKVSATAVLKTAESDERIEELKNATENVCPVHNFFKSTGIEMDIQWRRS